VSEPGQPGRVAERGGSDPPARSPWLAVGVLLLALNLRPLVVAVSPLLPMVRADTGMSAAEAGLLTTLPVLCFGALAPLAPRLGRRFGVEPTLLATMVVIVVGAAVRVLAPVSALLAGTVLIGGAIAVANVLIPGVIKRDFPARTGLMTGLYTMTLSGGPALAVGTTIPLARATGLSWRAALALWGVPAVLAVIVWLPQVRRHTRLRASEARTVEHPVRGLWRSPLAWAVTGYMGLQSLSFYTSSAWLPTRLADAGMSGAAAGAMLSVSTLVSIVGALAAPTLAGAAVRSMLTVLASAALAVAALVGLLVVPLTATSLWFVLLGLGQGSALSLAMLFIVRRAPDTLHAAQLSSMAQCCGYLLASVGPTALGALHDLTGGWRVPLVALLLIQLPQTAAALIAAQDRHVGGPGRSAVPVSDR
jgi:MFS transporter, CP family, cyanate transporter